MGNEFRFSPVPDLERLQCLEVDRALLSQFLERFSAVDERELKLRPYKRFILAGALREMLGEAFLEELREILLNRSLGGVLADFSPVDPSAEECLKLGTALTHMIGRPKRDPAGGTYFAWLTIEGSTHPASYQLGADSGLVLHTDGVYETGETDWIFFMKTLEENATGGETRLLHLDDWADRPRFLEHPLAFHPIPFRSEMYDMEPVEKSFFYRVGNDLRVRLNDQEAQPRNLRESLFIDSFLQSVQHSESCRTVELSVGAAVLLNNGWWLHGRDPFEPHPGLRRQIIRQRGHFAVTMD